VTTSAPHSAQLLANAEAYAASFDEGDLPSEVR
jgi:hypothetical protein